MAETLKTPMALAAFDTAAATPPQSDTANNNNANRNSSATTTITLAVENMVCGGCMRKVETALLAVPGVDIARANLSARRVTVVTDALVTDADALTLRLSEALADAGFKSAAIAADVDTERDAQERDLIFRMAVAGFAAANVMLLSVSVWSGNWFGDMGTSQKSLFHWLAALIALPAVAYAGQPFFRSALSAVSQRRINMDVPISLGVLLATGMSLFQTAFGHGDVYFDAAVMLLFFLLIGRVLDLRMRNRAASAATNLLALRAIAADVLGDDGSARRLPASALTEGMTILVAAGERVAVDGVVTAGRSEIDNSLITGETAPLSVAPGASVFAGAVNISAPVHVRAEAVQDQTVLAEIARLMASAEQSRGRYVRLADRAAAIYAPAVHILGLATLVGWLAVGADWVTALTVAIAVLIITCPCALALAVPAVQVAAAGRLFRRGILVKAADGLERLSACNYVVFDKTGTLTEGVPVLSPPGPDAADHLSLVAALARHSRHPYSKAIAAAAESTANRTATISADQVEERPGQGLIASTPEGEMRLGSAKFCNVDDAASATPSIWFRPPAGDPVRFDFTEALRPDAIATVAALQAAGFGVEILSGDTDVAVRPIARALGVAPYHANTTPPEKVARLEKLKKAGRNVLMVGDGLNDAPSLAAAHASMSPSEAADISQTVADAVFQGGRLDAVTETLMAARASQRMSFQNFGIALGYNALFVPMAVLGFVTPLIAAIAMSASSIAVTGNALRLRTKRLTLRRTGP